MPTPNIQLVIEVDPSRGNAAVRSFNTGVDRMGKTAADSTRRASRGFAILVSQMAAGVFAGNILFGATMRVLDAFKGLTFGAIRTADEIGKASQKIGISVETLSGLRYSAQLANVEFGQLETGLARMSRNVVEAARGSGEAKDAFGLLGLVLRDSSGHLRTIEQILSDVASKFAGMEDGATKTALAMQIFGRSGAELIPFLNQGAAGIAANSEELRKMGGIIGTETAKAAEQLEGDWKKLKVASEGLGISIGTFLIPKLTAATESLLGIISQTRSLVINLRELGKEKMPMIFSETGLTTAEEAFERKLNALLGIGLPPGFEKAPSIFRGFIGPKHPAASLEKAARILEIEKKQIEASAEFLRKAIESQLSERDKLFAQANEEMEKLKKEGPLAAQARLNIETALQLQLNALDKKNQEERRKEAIRLDEELGVMREKALADQIKLWDEQTDKYRKMLLEDLKLKGEFERQSKELELGQVDIARDTAMRRLELEQAGQTETLAQKIALESRKAAIEIEHIQRTHELKMELRRLEMEQVLVEQAVRLQQEGLSAAAIEQRLSIIRETQALILQGMDAETQAAIQAAQENAAIRQAEIVRNYYREVFDSLKSQAGDVFDALVTKSKSIWETIGDLFKTTILTAIKDTFSTVIATLLTPFMAAVRGAITGGGGGGFGTGPVGGNPAVLSLGAAAALPRFGVAGPGGTATTFPSGGGGGGLGGIGAGLAANLAGLKAFLGIGAARPGGLTGPFLPGQGATSLTSILSSPAAMLAGGLLAFGGLKRGGLSGLGMTTAGGALLGFKFGGPIGAAIGAGIGAIAGTVRLFIKGAEDKLRDKIRAAYGITIQDKGVLRQIIEIAKQSFGGNLDMAIRTPQIRDLIQLYAMSTGQTPQGLPAAMQPLAAFRSGGAVFQQITAPSGAVTLDRLATGTAANGGAQRIELHQELPITLDGEPVRKISLQTIIENGRVIAQSALSGLKASAGRREMRAVQAKPGLLTS